MGKRVHEAADVCGKKVPRASSAASSCVSSGSDAVVMASSAAREPMDDRELGAENVVLHESETLAVVKLLCDAGAQESATADRSFSSQDRQSAPAGELETIKRLSYQEPAAFQPDWSSEDSFLHAACEHGHYQIVKWLVETGIVTPTDLESQNALGLTPLMVAAAHHRLGIAGFLIVSGANVARLQDLEADIVHECAKHGNTNMLAFLLGHGVGSFEGNASIPSLIRVAAVGGHINTIQLLLSLRELGSPGLGACVAAAVQSQDAALVQLLCSSGADVNGTPLYYAIKLRDLAILEVLLYNGADLLTSIGAQMEYRSGNCALHYMISRGELEMIKLVQRIRGASVNLDLSDNGYPLELAASHGRLEMVKFLLGIQPPSFSINTVKRCHMAALSLATQKGHIEVAKLLLEHGADVNHATTNGYTALIQAAIRGQYDAVKWLCEHGADVERASSQGLTALCAAAQHGFAGIVEYLIEERQASLNVTTSYTMTPLGGAIANGHIDVVRVLLAHDDRSDNDDRGHPNLLGEALMNGYVELVKLLTTHAGDVNVDFTEKRALDSTSRYTEFDLKLPPLAIAAALGDLKLVEFLCEQGADVEAVTDMDETALFLAAEQGSMDVVKYLVENRNANINCVNSAPFNFTAVEVARNRGHDAVVQILRDHGASRPRKVIMEYDVYEDAAEREPEDSELTHKQRREMEYWDRKQTLEQLLRGREWM